MKHFVIQELPETEGCYTLDNKPLTNFILNVEKVIMLDTQMVVYKFEVLTSDDVYTIEVTQLRLNRIKFLQSLPVCIEDEKKFYDLLRKTISHMKFSEEDILYQTKCNGLQKVKGRYMFVFTNGSISKDGFHEEIYSGVGQMYIPPKAAENMDENKEVIEKLFQQLNHNPRVFYPMFFMNIMAITNKYFKLNGEPSFMKITLWVDGEYGSGKTELAKAVGNYTFGDMEWQKFILSATGKRKQALQCLSYSSGSVFVLDDIKNERVRDRKNSVRNLIDDCIRSVFQGQMTETLDGEATPKWLDCCSVITGEYMDTEGSQNTRILYLKIGKLVSESGNSSALYNLRDNPIWLTNVCCGYIQWFLEIMEGSSFSELIKEKLGQLRNNEKIYNGFAGAERLNENSHMLEMAALLVEKYFKDIGMPEDFLRRFHKNAVYSIKTIIDDTFFLLGGEQMIVYKIFERLFLKCSIRKASYIEDPFLYSSIYKDERTRYEQKYFCIDINEDFVWIDDYKKSLLKGNRGENEQYDENPCLIIRAERFQALFKEEINTLLEEDALSSAMADNLMCNLLKILRKMQIIYKMNRPDSALGRPSPDYPVFCSDKFVSCGENDSDDDEHFTNYEPTLQINTKLSCIRILKERMENEECTNDNIKKWKPYNPEPSEILKCRKAFINNKSLYKE